MKVALIAYADGSQSQPVEVTVKAQVRHDGESTMEVLAKVLVEYEPGGDVIVHVEQVEARSISVRTTTR